MTAAAKRKATVTWLAYDSQYDRDVLTKIFKKAKADLHLVKPAVDDAAFVAEVEAKLAGAERKQASTTQDFIDIGRMLLERKAIGKRVRRLQQYMQVAEAIDTADEATKTKISSFFPQGFDAVLNELQSLKRRAKKSRLAPVIIPDDLAARMRIIQGDCREVLPMITEPYIRATFPAIKDAFEVFRISDPPYNQGRPGYDGYDDKMPEDEYRNMIIQVYGGQRSVIIHYGRVIINKFGNGVLGECLKDVPWIYNNNLPDQHRLIAWFNCQPDLSRLGQPYKNQKDRRIIECMKAGHEVRLYDFWYIEIVKNVSKPFDHPCVLPVELARRIILVTTNPGDLIVNAFCGSGTIVAVAAALGRFAIGIDISEKYCEIARARLGTIERELEACQELGAAVVGEAAE